MSTIYGQNRRGEYFQIDLYVDDPGIMDIVLDQLNEVKVKFLKKEDLNLKDTESIHIFDEGREYVIGKLIKCIIPTEEIG